MSENNNIVVSLQDVTKKFGSLTVLDGMSLDIYEHEVVVLCGPSGGGKSTLLRTINGLEKIDSGKIIYRGQEVTHRNIREIRKHIGMVFQQFNLFSNLTVKDNLLIAPIKTQKKNKDEMLQKAKEYLEVFGIADKLDAYPHQLSGGQKQRVAIVRALMLEPDLMLFDEPTSALDPEMIKEVLDAIRRLSQIGMTMVIVTHEMGFAREVASRVCFLEGAKIRVDTDSKTFFEDTEDERLKQFLSVILHH
ncbi:ATP-binding cassette domain-containing protein [Vescimonas sp.]|uniref:amino acid ABC transporter ATP-binding protein n=1 Tax=Vescimonas sp. TaxID=2892404 RepID=UPI0015A0288B